MKLSRNVSPLKFISRAALLGALFIASSYAGARAAELIMFEQAGCAWCEAFDREIAPVYDKTEEGARAVTPR